MAWHSCITRPFKEKATGVINFEYCVGDDVVARIDGEMVPVKVQYLLDNLDGYYTAGVKGVDKDGNDIEKDVFSGHIFDPKIARFIGEDVAVEAGWPTNGIVKANIKDINNDGLIVAVDQEGQGLLVTANCIKNLKDVEITHDVFEKADASCFAPAKKEETPEIVVL